MTKIPELLFKNKCQQTPVSICIYSAAFQHIMEENMCVSLIRVVTEGSIRLLMLVFSMSNIPDSAPYHFFFLQETIRDQLIQICKYCYVTCGEINSMVPVRHAHPTLSHPLTPCSVNNDFAWLCNDWAHLLQCTCASWSTHLVTDCSVYELRHESPGCCCIGATLERRCSSVIWGYVLATLRLCYS